MPYPRAQHDAPHTKIFLLAFGMAGLAGHVNSAMLLAFGLPVSQMTGMASHMSEGMARVDFPIVLTAGLILLGFIGGATLSGLVIGRRQFPESPPYAWALALEMLLLLIAAVLALAGRDVASLTSAAFACGLQNALVASYRGLLIRTTHVTGIATDIGAYLARFLRRQVWSWHGWLLLVLLSGYIGGVLAQPLGTAGHRRQSAAARGSCGSGLPDRACLSAASGALDAQRLMTTKASA